MLVLTRKIGEMVRIGDEIQILVLSVNHSQVRIGIQAPPEVPVHREEIWQRIKNEEAANSA